MKTFTVVDILDTKKNHWIGKAVEIGVYRWERRTVVEMDDSFDKC